MERQPSSSPNLLWIVLEDVSPEFGPYDGPDAIETPNIDRLSQEGVTFTNAYATSPMCSPSRSALATGTYQTTIGAHHQRVHQDENEPSPPNPLPDGVRVVSDRLRDAGYLTANLTEFPARMDLEVNGKLDWNFDYRGRPFDTNTWEDLSDDSPFFAQTSLYEVHRGKFWDTAHERIPNPADPKDAEIPPYLPDHPTVREDFAQYYNTIMAADRTVGTILDGLESEGWLEKTVVVLLADHGRPMIRDKQHPYDSGLHVPLIIRWPASVEAPSRYRSGGVDDRLVSTIDVTATTLSISGVTPPEQMHGRRFYGDEIDPPREYVFGAVDRIAEISERRRTVRSKRFRYVRNYMPGSPWLPMNRYVQASRDIPWVLWKLDEADELDPIQAQYLADEKPPEELYDVREDPHQIDNLAESLDHRELLDEMRTVLDEWERRTGDRGRFPEYPEVVEYYQEQKAATFDDRIEERREEWDLQ
ncbi:sulfatase family protein [Halomontanus rarus]|uniref:sulfatase family protein n=1 Tax=Halomontanus rarus TaxID=3034020 RepID=UPI0023E7A602|nr:sulfatase [Halovivax sp. TS33]